MSFGERYMNHVGADNFRERDTKITVESENGNRPPREFKSWLVKYEVQNIQPVTTELNEYSEEEVEEYLKKHVPNLVRVRAIAELRKE